MFHHCNRRTPPWSNPGIEQDLVGHPDHILKWNRREKPKVKVYVESAFERKQNSSTEPALGTRFGGYISRSSAPANTRDCHVCAAFGLRAAIKHPPWLTRWNLGWLSCIKRANKKDSGSGIRTRGCPGLCSLRAGDVNPYTKPDIMEIEGLNLDITKLDWYRKTLRCHVDLACSTVLTR